MIFSRFLFVICLLATVVPAFSQSAPSGLKLSVSATLTSDGETISKGMIWRVFADKQSADGKLTIVESASGGSTAFRLPTGTYFVHAGFGRASATKRITLNDEDQSVNLVIDAGGLILKAESEGSKIDSKDLLFSVFSFERDEDGKRELIARNIRPNRLVRLNAGTYHVESTYGKINASVRADLEVNAGEVTRATLQHHGAKVMLKLVTRRGGNPLANTAWTVLTEQGEKVFESNAVSPSLVLSEGRYEASVRNGDQTYIHNFDVKAGKNANVEVLIGS